MATRKEKLEFERNGSEKSVNKKENWNLNSSNNGGRKFTKMMMKVRYRIGEKSESGSWNLRFLFGCVESVWMR